MRGRREGRRCQTDIIAAHWVDYFTCNIPLIEWRQNRTRSAYNERPWAERWHGVEVSMYQRVAERRHAD